VGEGSTRVHVARWIVGSVLALTMIAPAVVDAQQPSADLRLTLRSRVETSAGAGRFHAVTKQETWNPKQTAVIVCDMWDLHHCLNATKRGAEVAPRMNDVLKNARSRGATIIHAPSSCMEFYANHAGRKAALAVPKSKNLPKEIGTWCYKIPSEEKGAYPIDQTDGGEDDEAAEHKEWADKLAAMGRNPKAPWKRQTDLLEIFPGDFISDNGEEIWSILEQRGIPNVILVGVHTNMCVLGRPFGLRQMAKNGKHVVLMRDMTDTMYNPARAPYVSHFTGTDLIVEHIEKWVCPTVTSDQVLVGWASSPSVKSTSKADGLEAHPTYSKPFKFSKDTRPHVAIVMSEDEYKTNESLPAFARKYLGTDFKVSLLFGRDDDLNSVPGLEVLDEADLLLVSVRRRTLPTGQLDRIRKFIAAGKPVVGIRTASHAFSLRNNAPPPDGHAAWTDFDRDVLGGNYQNHLGQPKDDGPQVHVWAKSGVEHPILTGIPKGEFTVGTSLYKNHPIAESATTLLLGRFDGVEQQHPIAWTFQRQDGGQTFYTSLGGVTDFAMPEFQRLLLNGIYWACGREVPANFTVKRDLDDFKTSWQRLNVPGVWDDQAGGALANFDGIAWYRCFVKVPEDWEGKPLILAAEKIDNAHEAWFNGIRVGAGGAFPPDYKSGLDAPPGRYSISAEHVRAGSYNVVAIRVYDHDGQGGFKGPAPTLVSGDQAISLQGEWEFRVGNDTVWGHRPESLAAGSATFSKTIATPAELAQAGTQKPFPPAESLKQFVVPADLRIDQVLAEPIVRQPLFLNFDERGRLWVVQYLQYPYPAGLKMVSKDKFWRSVYDKIPEPPPHGPRGADKITIHEDTDGDGVFDKHKTFVEGLSITTSFAFGRGGVWVLNPPYLLFYPDKNHDDVPDGDPVVHLQGFGMEDTHSVTNSLRWGPDGWLYATQGSTVSAHVLRPGIDKEPIAHTMGQQVWRYHPETRRFEVFAEGGGNAFGCEMDDAGRVFSGHNGGDTRGFHYVQGGYSQKGFQKHGALSNPFTFGYFPPMKHHSVPRFTHNFVIYGGGALPADYAGKLFGVEPLQGQVVQSQFDPDGSTFQTKDINRVVTTTDKWFRPVEIKVGPDGGIYVADLYEALIAHGQHFEGKVDKTNGRVYRLAAKDAKPLAPFDLGRKSSAELVETLRHPNRWFRQTALRLLADRRDASVVPLLREQIGKSSGQFAVECLWALNLSGGFNDDVATKTLNHSDQFVRQWTVRLLCDGRQVSPAIAQQLAEVASGEAYVYVRSQLASSARRLPVADALSIVRPLLARSEDVTDPQLPLLLWWAIEAKVADSASPLSPRGRGVGGEGAERAGTVHSQATPSPRPSPPRGEGGSARAVLAMFEDRELWKQPLMQQHIASRLMQRFAASGARQDLLNAAKLFSLAPDAESTKLLMVGFEAAFKGRPLASLPPELTAQLAKAGGGSLSLRLRQGDAAAVADALKLVADDKTEKTQRVEFIQTFGEINQPASVPVLLKLLETSKDDEVRNAALTALQSYKLDEIGSTVVRLYGSFSDDVRTTAQTLLVSRANWTRQLLEAVSAGQIDARSLPLDVVRKCTLHRDDRIAQIVAQHWKDLDGASTAEMQTQLAHFSTVLKTGSGDPWQGKSLFNKSCAKCHILFGEGGRVGPDLTSFKRDDSQHILHNVVNPSLEVREGFETVLIVTDEGRTVTGFVFDQDSQVVVVRGVDGQNITVARDHIDEMLPQKKSIMPEGLLKDLTDQQVRDLFSYLRSAQPLN
jgi:putative membrane-bound dehydrogenase-like protein